MDEGDWAVIAFGLVIVAVAAWMGGFILTIIYDILQIWSVSQIWNNDTSTFSNTSYFDRFGFFVFFASIVERQKRAEGEEGKMGGGRKMNKKRIVGTVGMVGVFLIIAYMASASPAVEEMSIGLVKYVLPESDVDCSNCSLIKSCGAVCPCSAPLIPYHSAKEMDWENNSMYIVPVDGGHEFWIKENAIRELEECGEKMSFLSCKQPNEGSRRLSYLFVFERGGFRRTCGECYVVNDTWIEGKEVKRGF